MSNKNKKNKKGRGTVLSLNSFLGDTPTGTVVKKISSNEADAGEDESSTEQIVLQLPTAPKANRVFDDDSISYRPPFVARLSNLPFDGDEDDVREFFSSMSVVSLRLPREDGETGRMRGFGNIEFESRDDLIHALSLPDPILRGRRIRIDLFNGDEQQSSSQRTNKRGYSSFAESGTDRESTNWRQDSAASGASQNAPPMRSSSNSEQRDTSGWRQSSASTSSTTTAAAREESTSGNWRSDNRPNSGEFSSWRNRTDDERSRDSFSSQRQNERKSALTNERENFMQSGSSSSWRNRNDYGRRMEPNESSPNKSNQLSVEERPRLDLKPRTLPMPDIVVKEDITIKTTPEKTEATEKPDELAQSEAAETARIADAKTPIAFIEPEVSIEQQEDQCKSKNAVDPENVDDSKRFDAALKIAGDAGDQQIEEAVQDGAMNPNQRNESRNELLFSLETDSGHDSDGACGYDNRN